MCLSFDKDPSAPLFCAYTERCGHKAFLVDHWLHPGASFGRDLGSIPTPARRPSSRPASWAALCLIALCWCRRLGPRGWDLAASILPQLLRLSGWRPRCEKRREADGMCTGGGVGWSSPVQSWRGLFGFKGEPTMTPSICSTLRDISLYSDVVAFLKVQTVFV